MAAIPGTMVSSANVPQPVIDETTSSPRRNCWFRNIDVMPFMHKLGWPRPVQYGQVPHGGEKAMITWSPGATWVTPSPTAVTTPAPSWPSTAGGASGMVPFMADRSEWQTPLWAIFTWTSPGAMSRRVTSSAMTSSSVGVSVRIAANIGISSSVAPEWCRHGERTCRPRSERNPTKRPKGVISHCRGMDLRASRFKRVGSPKVIRRSRPEGLDWPP